MSYTNYDEVIIRYPALAKIAATPTIMNSSFVYYAEMELNSRLAPKFTTPFTGTTPPTIKDLAIDLTYYRCMLTRDSKEADKMHDRIIERIEGIKAGQETIYGADNTALAAQGGGMAVWSTTQNYHPVHSMLDAESTYVGIDDQRTTDEEDARE